MCGAPCRVDSRGERMGVAMNMEESHVPDFGTRTNPPPPAESKRPDPPFSPPSIFTNQSRHVVANRVERTEDAMHAYNLAGLLDLDVSIVMLFLDRLDDHGLEIRPKADRI